MWAVGGQGPSRKPVNGPEMHGKGEIILRNAAGRNLRAIGIRRKPVNSLMMMGG
jgi:hypothetical protein